MPELISMTTQVVLPFVLSVVGNLTTDKLPTVTKKIAKIFNVLSDSDQLPQNHHFERAISRAGLIASQVCIQQLIDNNDDRFMDDISHDVYIEGQRFQRMDLPLSKKGSYICLQVARQRIAELIQELKPVESERNKSQLTRFEKALYESRFHGASTSDMGSSIEASSILNKFATSELARIYSTSASVNNKENKSLSNLNGLRKKLAPNLHRFVIANILRYGKWKHEREAPIKSELQQKLFGANECWTTAFALAYIDELRKDTKLYRMILILRLENIEEVVESVNADTNEIKDILHELDSQILTQFKELSKTITDIETLNKFVVTEFFKLSEALKKHTQINGNQVFLSTTTAKNKGYSEFRPFYFGEEEDIFTGREIILNMLHKNFLAVDETIKKFQWIAICGGAGTGKSRLAHNILKSYASTWLFSGFVRKSFVKNADLKIDSLSGLIGSTLFVIDYAGNISSGLLAKYFAAFFRISRSSLTRFNSASSFAIFNCSSVDLIDFVCSDN